MALPITGPFFKTIEVKGPPNEYGYRPIWKYMRRVWSRQKRPYNHVLPYSYDSQEVKWSNNSNEYSQEYSSVRSNPYTSRYVDRVYRSAYAKYLDKSRSNGAELLTLFCERRVAADMIGTRALSLAAGFLAVKQRNLYALKKAWGKGAGWRENGRKQGSHILEYSFGWAPLMSDIAAAVDTLKDGHRLSGRVSQRSSFQDSLHADLGALFEREIWRTEIGIRMGWEISVDHPSIALLNQLGILNPLQTAWELTPWSFVIDYVVNVNDVISSMTALAGCSLHNQWFTTRIVDDYSRLAFWDVPSPPGYAPPSFGGTGVSVSRVTDIPSPSLGVRAPWNMSWSRASTSVALLLQQLK